jgi:gamma-glutamyltranspeptidase/glutathione hydrolase
MGGDAQPQIVLQMLARLLHVGQSPGATISAGRFNLASPDPKSGFETWSAGGAVRVLLEPRAGVDWAEGLTRRGHHVEVSTETDLSGFGHAHMIEVTEHGSLAGASDPRAWASAALGR